MLRVCCIHLYKTRYECIYIYIFAYINGADVLRLVLTCSPFWALRLQRPAGRSLGPASRLTFRIQVPKEFQFPFGFGLIEGRFRVDMILETLSRPPGPRDYPPLPLCPCSPGLPGRPDSFWSFQRASTKTLECILPQSRPRTVPKGPSSYIVDT